MNYLRTVQKVPTIVPKFVRTPTFQQYLDAKPDLLKRFPDALRLDENKHTKLKYLANRNSLDGLPNGPTDYLAASKNNNFVYTFGIRHSLNLVFNFLKTKDQNFVALIPNDVYPRYFEIADQSKINYEEYSLKSVIDGKKSFDNFRDSNTSLLILPDPLFPYRGRIEDSMNIKNAINSYYKDDSKNNYIFVDSVYNYQNPELFPQKTTSLQKTKCFYSTSMSKTFLLPDPQLPFVGNDGRRSFGKLYLPDKEVSSYVALDRDYLETQAMLKNNSFINYVINNKDLPEKQLQKFDKAWTNIFRKVGDTFLLLDKDWIKPDFYYSVLPINYLDLLERYNILGIPGSCLNRPNSENYENYESMSEDLTIITCLHEVQKMDKIFENQKKKDMYHVSTVSNFVKGFDKYQRTFSKENIEESTFPDKFFLLNQDELDIGFKKANKILEKNSKDDYLILKTRLKLDEVQRLVKADTGLGQSIDRNWINLVSVFDKDMNELVVEDVVARSIMLNNDTLMNYKELKPLTVSVLPIAKGCQAKCPFCFSHSSISEDKSYKNFEKQLPDIKKVLEEGAKVGASRAVITGGGEPGLVKHENLCELIKLCSKDYDKTVIITNGYMVGSKSEEERVKLLKDYVNNGLTVLSVSRHGYNNEVNEKIMYLNTRSDKIAETVNNPKYGDMFKDLTLRYICVLQKGGVDTMETMEEYMDFITGFDLSNSKVSQVTFKELYFSTSVESVYHDFESNKWSLKNQVPLNLVHNFANKHGLEIVDKLAWGSPIYRGYYKGKQVQIAAYTEPSVFWERTNGLCRSWNLLTDGKVYASLEDKQSLIDL